MVHDNTMWQRDAELLWTLQNLTYQLDDVIDGRFVYSHEAVRKIVLEMQKAIAGWLGAAEADAPLASDAMLMQRLSEFEKQVRRLQAFAEEMSWYAPEDDWEDAARRLLHVNDVRSIEEVRIAAAQRET